MRFCHPRESWEPKVGSWLPAFAGMTGVEARGQIAHPTSGPARPFAEKHHRLVVITVPNRQRDASEERVSGGRGP